MRPRARRGSGQQDLLRARLDQIVDLAHPLTKLARTIDRRLLEERLGASCAEGADRPLLLRRLMAGLAILKQMHRDCAMGHHKRRQLHHRAKVFRHEGLRKVG